MEWSDRFSVNIETVDSQHRKLVELLNNFHDAMKAGKGKEIMARTLSDLVDYTSYHFSTEEGLFKVHAYPDYMQHKKEHDVLTKQALELKERYSRGELIISADTMAFLKNWLSNHILGSDMKYAPFLKGKGVQ
jgi:hemerythrin-like metal-binding protein